MARMIARTVPETGDKPKLGTRKQGSGAHIKLNHKGEMVGRHIPHDFAGISQESLKESSQMAAGSGDNTFDAASPPRVGGTITPGSVASGTANKRLVKRSMKQTKTIAASPQAKRSIKRLYKNQ